jgi:hypothetical protein
MDPMMRTASKIGWNQKEPGWPELKDIPVVLLFFSERSVESGEKH